MSDILNLRSTYLNYLTPLLKWRIMDIESLRRECVYAPKYNNFYRVIRSLEKKKILEGYKDPFSKKKFIYLSSLGESELSLKENPTALSPDTLIHDIKVSEISRSFLNKRWIDDVELEHQIHDKRNFRTNYKIIPDAIFYGRKKGVNFKIAFELELTRKNNQRILEKANQFLESSYYNYAIYFFTKIKLQEKYLEIFNERFNSNEMGRFMFFTHQGEVDMGTIQGHFKGKKLTLNDLFIEN